MTRRILVQGLDRHCDGTLSAGQHGEVQSSMRNGGQGLEVRLREGPSSGPLDGKCLGRWSESFFRCWQERALETEPILDSLIYSTLSAGAKRNSFLVTDD